MKAKPHIAIIGAGISGLTLAQNLKEHADIVVFEKARGVGGRMSTRRADPFHFDHGTQSFTARTKVFQEFLKPYTDSEAISEWKGKIINLEIDKKTTKRLWFEPHLVACPNMNSLCKNMAAGIDVRVATEVAPLHKKQSDKWQLHDKDGKFLGEYDWVISTAPSPQTLNLFQIMLPESSAVHSAQMQGCFSLMIGFNKPWDRKWIGTKVRNNAIEWISINSSKPHRDKTITSIVAQTSNDWAELHLEDDINQIQAYLIEQFEKLTNIKCNNANYIATHRWKYALAEETQKSGFYIDEKHKVAASSDWGSSSRIEDVWLNATGLAKVILGTTNI